MASEIFRLASLDWSTLADLARAVIELGKARLRLGSQPIQTLVASTPSPATEIDAIQLALVHRVAFAIPRIAARVPWRADCLVQALAAQQWLGRHHIATALTLGVRKGKPADFEAHAWLRAGDRIVTGGDISGFVPLRGARD